MADLLMDIYDNLQVYVPSRSRGRKLRTNEKVHRLVQGDSLSVDQKSDAGSDASYLLRKDAWGIERSECEPTADSLSERGSVGDETNNG